MSEHGYWKERIGRRALLRGSAIAGVGLGAAALVGCGTKSATTTPQTTLATTAPTTSTPKRGGVYRVAVLSDPPTWDPFSNSAGVAQTFAASIYSRLFRNLTKPGANPFDLDTVPDAAESAESIDGQNWVVKLRKGVKFHNKAPLNGRELTTQDVMTSWKLATAKTSVAAAILADYAKIEAVDDYTLKFTMKTPSPTFQEVLADTVFYILPKEVDGGGVDRKSVAIGTGPWVLDSYETGVRMKFSRNPNFYIKDALNFDGREWVNIPEYGNRLAQFEAGNLHSQSTISADDVLPLRTRQPKLQWLTPSGNTSNWVNFSGPAQSPNAPWRDERFRQAVSMAINRPEMNELGANASALKKAGITPNELWGNVVPVGRGKRWWLDPQSAAQGDSAKFFKYNLAEAKKLLAAMGGAPKESFPYVYTPQYGKTFVALGEAVGNYLRELGLNLVTDVQDYNSKYVTGAYRGDYRGIGYMVASSPSEVGAFMSRFFGDDPVNRGRIQPPEISSLLKQAGAEMNPEKRSALFMRMQVLNGEKMYYVPTQSQSQGDWTGYRPEIQNAAHARDGRGSPAELDPYMWFES